MSALAQKAAAEKRLKSLIDTYAQIIADGHRLDLDEIRRNQGVIQGLRLAIEAQGDAYKDIGG